MDGQNGSVELIGIKPAKALVRYIEKQVEKWIQREQTLMFLPKDCDYSVVMEREPIFSRCYSCSIDIRIGSKYWQSHEQGTSVQEALKRAMKALRALRGLTFERPEGTPKGQQNHNHPVAAS